MIGQNTPQPGLKVVHPRSHAEPRLAIRCQHTPSGYISPAVPRIAPRLAAPWSRPPVISTSPAFSSASPDGVFQMCWDDHCGRRATTGRLSPREV